MSCFDDYQPYPAELVALDLVPLDLPRMPTDEERELMEELVASLGLPALEQQVALARVVSACSCGCRSVGLRTDGPWIAPSTIRDLDPEGPRDAVRLATVRCDDDGVEIEVTLHVVGGRVEELEIWAEELSRPLEG